MPDVVPMYKYNSYDTVLAKWLLGRKGNCAKLKSPEEEGECTDH